MWKSRQITIRITPECLEIIDRLCSTEPHNYPNWSSVIRAGLFTLDRWKEAKNINISNPGINEDGRD